MRPPYKSYKHERADIDIPTISRRAYSFMCSSAGYAGGLSVYSTTVPQHVPTHKYKLPFNKNKKLFQNLTWKGVEFMGNDYFVLFNFFCRLYAIAIATKEDIEIVFCMEDINNMYFVLDKETYEEFTPVWMT